MRYVFSTSSLVTSFPFSVLLIWYSISKPPAKSSPLVILLNTIGISAIAEINIKAIHIITEVNFNFLLLNSTFASYLLSSNPKIA